MTTEAPPPCWYGCGETYAVDREYGEGYCRRLFDEQQASNEPITDYVLVEDLESSSSPQPCNDP